jgi:hypothetical protein
MADVVRYHDCERHGLKPRKQGGTAEHPFVPELAKGNFFSGILLSLLSVVLCRA